MGTKYTSREQIEEMRMEILREKQKMSGVCTREDRNEEMHRRKRLAVKAAGWIMFLSVTIVLSSAIASIYIAKSRGELPSLFGRFQFFVVESGSMEPTLNVGSVIICRKPENGESFNENEIVTFRTLSGAVVTHRIVEVVTGENGKNAYRTRGDNPQNSTDAELLTTDRVIAVFIAKVPLT